MRLRFEMLGVLQRLAGADSVNLECPPDITVAQALELLAQQQPTIAAELERCAVAQGDALIRRSNMVEAGSTLALLPPVAGG